MRISEWRASRIASITSPSARVRITTPSQSSGLSVSSRISATIRGTTRPIRTQNGRLARKIHRHPTPELIMPPRLGPSAMATPETTPTMPKARARGPGAGNADAIKAKAPVTRKAAPPP
jgi:hypothetical protein